LAEEPKPSGRALVSHALTTKTCCAGGILLALSALSVIALLPPSGCVIEKTPAFSFLRQDSTWEGELRHFVDRDGGLEQAGRARPNISISPEGRTEKRRHDLHHCFLAEKKLLLIRTVSIDGHMLVFANNRLERTGVKPSAVG